MPLSRIAGADLKIPRHEQPNDLFSSRPLTLSPPLTSTSNDPFKVHSSYTSVQPPIAKHTLTRTPSPTPHSPPSNLELGKSFSTWRNRKIRVKGPLPWPADLLERERTEAEHYLLRLLIGYPYLGPVESVLRTFTTSSEKDRRERDDEAIMEEGPKRMRVLDIATGCGLWAGDIGEMFPWVYVVGCDDVPMMDKYTWDNVDVDLDHLPYEPESFNVVHIRFAKLRVTSYPHLLRSAYNLLRPGGLLLIFDTASPPTLSTGRSTTGCQAWTDAFHRSLSYAGMSPFSVDEVIKTFRGESVEGSDMRVPIGHGEGRMGQLGKIHMINTKAYLEAGRNIMTERGGYTDAEVDVLTAAFLQDVKEHPLYTKYHAFTVRKP